MGNKLFNCRLDSREDVKSFYASDKNIFLWISMPKSAEAEKKKKAYYSKKEKKAKEVKK